MSGEKVPYLAESCMSESRVKDYLLSHNLVVVTEHKLHTNYTLQSHISTATTN